MVHLVWIYFARIVGIGCVGVAYLFYLHSRIDVKQLELKSGQLVENPTISHAPVSGKAVIMKLHLLNEKEPLTIPGKILQLADPRTTELKKGDNIKFHEKSKKDHNIFDNIRRLAYSVSDEQGAFYTKEQSIGYYKGSSHKRIIVFFILIGMISVFLAWKWRS